MEGVTRLLQQEYNRIETQFGAESEGAQYLHELIAVLVSAPKGIL